MPSRKRGRKSHKPPTDPQPSSSQTSTAIAPAEAVSQELSEDVASGAGLETELGQLTLQARLDVTQAQIVVSDLGCKGHNYKSTIVKENARAHLGDVHNVYNFHQPPADEPVDSEGTRLMEALSFDGMNDRLISITPAYGETCSWILDRPEYLRWRDPDQRESHHGVLWIKGKAATGKSTLMSCLYDHVHKENRGEVVITFFFNARSPDSLVKSTEGMYRCLLHQILKHLPRLRGSLSQIQAPRSKEEAWPIERLENAFRLVVLDLMAGGKITCFIDALDECKTEDVRRAIGYFEDLADAVAKRSLQFLVCFTSRYYPQITMRRHEELKLDVQPEHMQDIFRYIDNKLIVPWKAKLELSPKIYDRSSGIFLWVVLVVKRLREKSDTGSTRSQLLEILDSIPEELGKLFADVVAEPDISLISIVQWSLFSTRTLTIGELYFAVQGSVDGATGCLDSNEIDEDGMTRYLGHASRGLMEISYTTIYFTPDGDGERVKMPGLIFIHESVREYFLRGGLASMDRPSLHGPNAVGHAKLAQVCLSYLVSVIDQPSFSTLCRPSEPKETVDAETTLPFVDYATRNVLRHTEVAFASGVVDLSLLESLPLPHMMKFLNTTPGNDHALKYEDPLNLFPMLLDQHCPGLARAVLAQTPPLLPSSTPTRYNKVGLSWTRKNLAKPDLTKGCDSSRCCLLDVAVNRGNKDFIELLSDYGADVNMEEGPCVSPVCVATAMDDLSLLQLLFRCGARIDTAKTRNILHFAIGQGAKKEIVQYLLERGVDANDVDDSSQTALHLTTEMRSNASHDDATMVRILVDAGANMEIVDHDGDTVLIRAAGSWRTLLVQVLLEKGANVHSRDHSSLTALHVAVEQDLSHKYRAPMWLDHEVFPVLQALLDAGADINADGGSYGTAIVAACINEQRELVNFLVDRGAIFTPQGRQYDGWVANFLSEASQPDGNGSLDSWPLSSESDHAETLSTAGQSAPGDPYHSDTADGAASYLQCPHPVPLDGQFEIARQPFGAYLSGDRQFKGPKV
jgi:hypothetical protein